MNTLSENEIEIMSPGGSATMADAALALPSAIGARALGSGWGHGSWNDIRRSACGSSDFCITDKVYRLEVYEKPRLTQ